MYAKFFVISILIAIMLFNIDYSAFYPLLMIFLMRDSDLKPPEKVFTPTELKQFNGVDRPQLYLALLGKVFDVSKGAKHYGPGGPYNFFIGKDSSRSFVTGKFNEGDEDDRVADLAPEELRSLNHWIQFYKKEYERVGKVMGPYYEASGKLTRYGKEVKRLIKRAEAMKESDDLGKVENPACNVEWSAEEGSRVWCSRRSGGVARDWVGFPRQLYEPGLKEYRCACMKTSDLTSNVKLYDGCDSESDSCFVKTDS